MAPCIYLIKGIHAYYIGKSKNDTKIVKDFPNKYIPENIGVDDAHIIKTWEFNASFNEIFDYCSKLDSDVVFLY